MKVAAKSRLLDILSMYPLLIAVVAVVAFAGAGVLWLLGLAVPPTLVNVGGVAALTLLVLAAWVALLCLLGWVIGQFVRLFRGQRRG